MENSVLLARLIGPVLAVMGLWVLLRPGGVERAAREFLDSAALMLIAGILAFVPGLAIVLAHNVWVAGWPVLVTLIGWIALLAGLARIFLADAMRQVGLAMLERSRTLILPPGIAMVALGAYLSFKGFGG